MENNSNKWKGNDVSLSECIEEYGMVYTYDGDEFNGWIADGVDKDGNITTFAPFWMDNNCIDDYFDDEGDKIADMCGTTPEEMDYEWKMDALMSYYGGYEFVGAVIYRRAVSGELEYLIVQSVVNNNWGKHQLSWRRDL